MNVTVVAWVSHQATHPTQATAWVLLNDDGETIAATYSFDRACADAGDLMSRNPTHAPAATETTLEAPSTATEGTQPTTAPKRRRNAVVRPLRRQDGGHLQE